MSKIKELIVARIKAGFPTQAAAARAIGIKRAHYARIEAGTLKTAPQPKTMLAIANALEINPLTILAWFPKAPEWQKEFWAICRDK